MLLAVCCLCVGVCCLLVEMVVRRASLFVGGCALRVARWLLSVVVLGGVVCGLLIAGCCWLLFVAACCG